MLKNGIARVLLTGTALVLLTCLITPQAHAVWHSVLTEHFEEQPQQFPMSPWVINPFRAYGGQGAPWTWGIQNYIFKPNETDNHSIWCVGLPGDLDPEYDPYPNNINCWAKCGPFNFSQAVAAKATFWYYYQTGSNQDYLRWGAYNQNAWNMLEVNRKFGLSSQWWSTTINLDSLPSGSSWVSYIGQSSVYILFQFVSNSFMEDSLMGCFVDEVHVGWDDGLYDLFAQIPGLAHTDSSSISQAITGDSLRFSLIWSAEGTGVTPLFNITARLDGQPFYTERRNIDLGLLESVVCTTYTDIYHVSDTLSHTVSWMVDAGFEIDEGPYEANNDTFMVFQPEMPNISPTLMITRPAWGDTANQQFTIQYEAHDPNDEALISFYWTADTSTGYGTQIPGALAIPEADTTDTFLWNTASVTPGAIWVRGIISDGMEMAVAYSQGPVIINHTWGLAYITLTSPAVMDSADTEFLITWTDSDPTDSALISLYWDNNNVGYNGTPIAGGSGIPASDTTDSFLWNTTSMSNGVQVWLLAKIQTPNGTIWDYAPAPLVIVHNYGLGPWASPEEIPKEFTLENIYPNPFNNSTTIRVALPHQSHAQIRIFDSLGRWVATPFTGMLSPGLHEIPWTPANLTSGIYLVKFNTPGVELQSRAVYLK
jgi:hypothetical protein